MQIKNVTATHKKDFRILLENLSFVLEAGDKMAVIGEEGNGKSTLLNIIGGLDKATGGTVCVGGMNVSSMSEMTLILL